MGFRAAMLLLLLLLLSTATHRHFTTIIITVAAAAVGHFCCALLSASLWREHRHFHLLMIGDVCELYIELCAQVAFAVSVVR